LSSKQSRSSTLKEGERWPKDTPLWSFLGREKEGVNPKAASGGGAEGRDAGRRGGDRDCEKELGRVGGGLVGDSLRLLTHFKGGGDERAVARWTIKDGSEGGGGGEEKYQPRVGERHQLSSVCKRLYQNKKKTGCKSKKNKEKTKTRSKPIHFKQVKKQKSTQGKAEL